MKERIFTPEDKEGLARALQTLLTALSGPNQKDCHQMAVHALDAGLTADEILNEGNYRRVYAYNGGRVDAEEYIDALIRNLVPVRPLTEEEGWDGDTALLCEIVRDFFDTAEFKGPFATISVKTALQKAIQLHGLQTLLDFTLLKKISKENNITAEQYYTLVWQDKTIESTITAKQKQRRELELCSQNEAADTSTESAPVHEDYNEEPAIQPEAEECITLFNPLEMKRTQIMEAIKTLQAGELITLLKAFEEDKCVEEIINDLANGKTETLREDIQTRNVHQILNSVLYPFYIYCAKMQGIDIREETAAKTDFLSVSWDMRDEKTRKLHKVRELIMNCINTEENEDNDLLGALRDLENLYK